MQKREGTACRGVRTIEHDNGKRKFCNGTPAHLRRRDARYLHNKNAFPLDSLTPGAEGGVSVAPDGVARGRYAEPLSQSMSHDLRTLSLSGFKVEGLGGDFQFFGEVQRIDSLEPC